MAAELVHRVRPAGGKPQGLLLLLHGRGADENDLFPLLDILDPQRHLLGVTPRAPIEIFPGYHWYITREVGFPDPPTFREACRQLADWVTDLMASEGIDSTQLFIGGFSMGAVMSYALALGPWLPPPASLFVFSGFIPTVEGFEPDFSRLQDTPVLVGHGAFDPVMAPEWGRSAKEQLEKSGIQVTYLETAMAHAIDPSAIEVAASLIAAN